MIRLKYQAFSLDMSMPNSSQSYLVWGHMNICSKQLKQEQNSMDVVTLCWGCKLSSVQQWWAVDLLGWVPATTPAWLLSDILYPATRGRFRCFCFIFRWHFGHRSFWYILKDLQQSLMISLPGSSHIECNMDRLHHRTGRYNPWWIGTTLEWVGVVF